MGILVLQVSFELLVSGRNARRLTSGSSSPIQSCAVTVLVIGPPSISWSGGRDTIPSSSCVFVLAFSGSCNDEVVVSLGLLSPRLSHSFSKSISMANGGSFEKLDLLGTLWSWEDLRSIVASLQNPKALDYRWWRRWEIRLWVDWFNQIRFQLPLVSSYTLPKRLQLLGWRPFATVMQTLLACRAYID